MKKLLLALALVIGLGMSGTAYATAYDWYPVIRDGSDLFDRVSTSSPPNNGQWNLLGARPDKEAQFLSIAFGDGFAENSNTLILQDISESKIFGLVADLASLTSGKANVSHMHTTSDITNFNTSTDARIALAIASSSVQRIRAQTNTSGVYTWTFPKAYATTTLPVVAVSIETNTTDTWSHAITALSSTSVSIQLTRATPVTILGISVLGVSATPQAYIDIIAVPQ